MSAPAKIRPRRPMSLWRLEVLRLTRTRRWIAPVGIYTVFGLTGPATERYLGDLISRFGGVEVVLPEPTPAGGFTQYVSNASQLGVLAVVVVAASSLTIDRPPEMGVFLRTRVRSARDLLVPRIVVIATVAVTAWILGTGSAWYETSVLLGAVSPTPVVVGALYGAVYLSFVVSLVAWIASFGRTAMTSALVGMTTLVVLPVIGLVPLLGRWIPSELVGALDASVAGAPLTEPLPAAGVAILGTIALVLDAVRRTATREV